MQNDIEIYIHKGSPDRINGWLQSVFGVAPVPQSSPGGKHSHAYRIICQDIEIPVLLIVQGAWTSVWFNSDRTPWESDLACAQAAAQTLGTRARCTDGGWHEGDDPDQFLEVAENRVSTIIWRDE